VLLGMMGLDLWAQRCLGLGGFGLLGNAMFVGGLLSVIPGDVTVSHWVVGRLKCTCPHRLHANSQLQTILRNFRSRQDERAPYECRSTKSLCEQRTTIVLLNQSTHQRWASQTRDRYDGKAHACPHSHLGQIGGQARACRRKQALDSRGKEAIRHKR